MTFDSTATPPRDPFHPPEAAVSNQDPQVDPAMPDLPAVPQEPVQAPQGARLNLTAAKQIADRLRVMEDRFESYFKLLEQYGVKDSAHYVGPKAHLAQSGEDMRVALAQVRAAHQQAEVVVQMLEELG